MQCFSKLSRKEWLLKWLWILLRKNKNNIKIKELHSSTEIYAVSMKLREED